MRLIRDTDRGSQYPAICYTERLAEAGIEPSVGSVGDSRDNAFAETVIVLFKPRSAIAEHLGATSRAVEFGTLERVD